MKIGTILSTYVVYLFVIASALCTIVLLRGFLRSPPEIPFRTKSRYSLLQKHFGSSNEISEYIEEHEYRAPMYKQLYWMIIDDWPAYTIVPAPGDRIFCFSILAAIFRNSMELSTKRTIDEPVHASIYTFYSAAPTMTNSRVEALGTGSQPPYLTIATSFSAAQAHDDNLLGQLKKADYKVHLIGDSLWSSVFPKELYDHIDSSSAYSQASLDRHINERAETKLTEDDWDVLITHANELDHISHKYTFNSKQAVHELQQNDRLIDRNIKIMHEEALLLAFGDHGSTIAEGSHGGGTKEEIESGFFGYTKKGFTFKNFQHPEKLPQKTRELIENLKRSKPGLFDFLVRDAFYQVDIVPTTASMFNIPIPFKNLGTIIPELLHYNVSEERFVSQSIFELLMDYLINFLQAYHYDEVAFRDHKEMKEQWVMMKKTYKEHRHQITTIVEKLQKAMKIEEGYFKGLQREMPEVQWKEYAKTIETAIENILILKEALAYHRTKFTEQWCAIDMLYLYGSWILRILLTISLAIFILITDYVVVKKRFEIMNQYTYYKYAILAQVILILIIAFQSKLDIITIPISFLLCLYTIFAQGKIIYNELPEIVEYIKESNIFPIIATLAIYVYCTFFMGTITSLSNFLY